MMCVSAYSYLKSLLIVRVKFTYSFPRSPYLTSGPLVTPLAVAEKKGYNAQEEMCRSFSEVERETCLDSKKLPCASEARKNGTK
jgi:hypothetical protein